MNFKAKSIELERITTIIYCATSSAQRHVDMPLLAATKLLGVRKSISCAIASCTSFKFDKHLVLVLSSVHVHQTEYALFDRSRRSHRCVQMSGCDRVDIPLRDLLITDGSLSINLIGSDI